MACCDDKSCDTDRMAQDAAMRGVLRRILGINAVMFALEFGAGLAAGSSALMADSLDMLGDATVYALSLYALSRSIRWKARAAMVKGLLILSFAIGISVEILVKLRTGLMPSFDWMATFGLIALFANVYCLSQLWRFRSTDVNMASSFECSRNDVIANVGVLLAAAGVFLTQTIWPDIVVASILVLLFFRSAWRVITSASQVLAAEKTT